VKTLLTLIGLSLALLGAPASGIASSTPGTWRFRADERPVKAVIIGGSVAAWPRGGFGQFIETVCSRVEVRNRAKAKLGARALKKRFALQVLRNRRIDLDAHESTWLIFMGGLNSVGTPKMTNRAVASTLVQAHERGIKTLALTVGPWGAEHDKRWRGASGLRYQDKTRLTVDFLMGRLTPQQAFGRGATEGFTAGQLPDIAVDLYDSELRDREAPLRDEPPTARRIRYDKELRRSLRKLPQADREAESARALARALSMPKWFMKKKLQAFDHIHPNMEGHRVIARTVCPSLPPAWGCDCTQIEGLRWDREARGLIPANP